VSARTDEDDGDHGIGAALGAFGRGSIVVGHFGGMVRCIRGMVGRDGGPIIGT
jgi:hypothetical protein